MVAAARGLRPPSLSLPIVAVPVILVAAGLAGAAVAATGGSPFVPAALVGIAAAVAVVWNLELGLWAFILATALNRYNFDVAGWQMKPEHMVLLLMVAAWSVRFLWRRERLERLPLAAIIVAFVAVNFVASMLHSPDLAKSLRILTRMTLGALAYIFLVNQALDRGRLWRLVAVFLGVAAAAAVYGIGATAAWQIARLNIGVQENPITHAWSPYGTLWEGNIFGAYVMSASVASLVLLASKHRTLNRWFLATVFALTAMATLLSQARAAWLGFGVALLFLFLFLGKLRFRNVAMVLVGGTLALLVLGSMNPGGVLHDVWDRVSTLQAPSEDATVRSRLSNAELALEDWRAHRLLGWGTEAFPINHPEIGSALPSPQLNALYDTGIIGAAIFMALIGAIMLRSLVAVMGAPDSPERSLLLALWLSFIGLFIAFQATDAFWLGFTWIHLSLLAAAGLVVQAQARERAIVNDTRRVARRGVHSEATIP